MPLGQNRVDADTRMHGILRLVEAGFKPASTAIVRHGLPEIALTMTCRPA